MGVQVLLPTALRSYANDQADIVLEGGNVGEVLDNLTAEFPELKQHLFDDEGNLRNFVNVYVNEDNIRALDMSNSAVKDGDEITLVPAVAGGRP